MSANVPGFRVGTYTLQSTGGADVKNVLAQATIGAPLVWTNHSAFESLVPRAQGLRVTWTASSVEGLMTISRGSAISSPAPGVVVDFQCTAPVDAGEFTIPSLVLSSLPASKDAGYLSVQRTVMSPFAADGLDTGVVIYGERERTEAIRFQ
jgi:hypothetical protein